MRERVIVTSDCILGDPGGPEAQQFEPAAVFNNLPTRFSDLLPDLVIVVTDGDKRVEYGYDKFMSKTYPIRNGKVKFGAKKMSLSALRITVGITFRIEDLTHLQDDDMD